MNLVTSNIRLINNNNNLVEAWERVETPRDPPTLDPLNSLRISVTGNRDSRTQGEYCDTVLDPTRTRHHDRRWSGSGADEAEELESINLKMFWPSTD